MSVQLRIEFDMFPSGPNDFTNYLSYNIATDYSQDGINHIQAYGMGKNYET